MSSYARPSSLQDALGLLAGGRGVVLAGGTDLYPGAGAALAGDVVDLGGVAELRGISADGSRLGGGLRIGAATTWSEIAEATLPAALRGLQQAALQVGGRQIQNMGTIGGNLCNASPAADGVPPLLVLGAEVELAGLAGRRRLPLPAFLLGVRQTGLRPGEIVLAIWLPEAGLRGVSAFLKLGARAYLVISIAMVAVRIVVEAGRVAEAAVAVGACSAVAQRLVAVEQALTGAPLAQAAARVRLADVAAGLMPIDDIRASAAYRTDAAAELLRRAVADLVADLVADPVAGVTAGVAT